MADQNSNTDTPRAATQAAPASTSAQAAAAPAKVAAAPAAPAAKADKPKRARKAAAPRAARAARKSAPKAAAKTATKRAKAPSRARPAAAAAATTAAKASVRKLQNKQTRLVNEGTKTMITDTNNVAERVQAVFGDVNARAKTAIERNTKIAEEMTELGRGNVEAVVASTKVVARGLETIGQDVAEFGRKSFEDASAALKSFAEVKTPTDFFRLQSEFARSQFDAMVSESSKLSETVLKLAGEVSQPITNRASIAADRVRSAVSL